MKLALAIVAFGFFTIAQAGVGHLHHHEEQEVLHAFEKYCGHGSEGGEFHGGKVWCKFAKEGHEEVIKHQVIVPAPVIPDSLVFIKPPSIKYHSKIDIVGTKGIGQKTKIYLLPIQSSHSITSKVIPGEIVGTKPTVYFIQKSKDNGYGYQHSHAGFGGQEEEGHDSHSHSHHGEETDQSQ